LILKIIFKNKKNIILIYFNNTKNILKNNHNHISKQEIYPVSSPLFFGFTKHFSNGIMAMRKTFHPEIMFLS
jgi:hypothetical protein